MKPRIPLIPTIIVVTAAAIMIALGVWQVRRAQWKEGLIHRYAEAETMPPITWPTVPLKDADVPLFRHATGLCQKIVGKRAVAGENRTGDPGYVQVVDCTTGAEGPGMSVQLGWSQNPNAKFVWNGGLVSGIIGPDSRTRMRLVAGTAPQGLEPSAPPSIRAIPNNHRSYALQWFSFAVIALIIYGLALRKRMKEEPKA